MTAMRWILAVWVIGGLAGAATSAEARIYKYKKANGTVVYTDKLSDLPADRRAHYNQLEAEAEKQRKRAEKSLGKAAYDQQEAEKKRNQIMQAELNAQERQRRLQALDEMLKRARKRNEEKGAFKKHWQERMQKARKRQQELLDKFNKAAEEYKSLATKASFALFPGQAKRRDDLKKELAQLEQDLDQAIHELEVTIPLEARRAGVPPGWLR